MYGIDVPRSTVLEARDNLHAHMAEIIREMGEASGKKLDRLCEQLGRADSIHVFLTDMSCRVTDL